MVPYTLLEKFYTKYALIAKTIKSLLQLHKSNVLRVGNALKFLIVQHYTSGKTSCCYFVNIF